MEDSFGTTKISDGLYIGDQFSSKDIDTIVMNHISHIINLNSKLIENQFETYGIIYLNFDFNQDNKDKDKQIVLDSLDKNISRVIQFIQQTRDQGESILVHGIKSYTIGLVFYCAYFMLKYKWSMYKTIEFLENRVNKLQISNPLIRQLRAFQSRISQRLTQPLSVNWNIYPGISLQQQTLRNTYLNSFINNDNNAKPQSLKYKSKRNVTWEQRPKTLISNTKKGSSKSILKYGGIQLSEQRQKRTQSASRKSASNIRGQSKKQCEKQLQKKIKLLKQQPIQSFVRNTQSPLVKRKRQQSIKQTQPQVLRYSIDKKQRESSKHPTQPFVTLFKNTPIPPKQLLNKSLGLSVTQRQPLHVRFDTDNSAQKQKQRQRQHSKQKQSLKDQVARKLLKKMILDKGSSIASLQNKQNTLNIQKKKDVLSKTKCQSQVVLSRPKKVLQSERVSEDSRKQRQSSNKRTMINNFVKEKTTQSRPESPLIKKSENKMDVEKIKTSLQMKIQSRGQSPAQNQNRMSLKDASALLNTIFPQHNYRPKWKF